MVKFYSVFCRKKIISELHNILETNTLFIKRTKLNVTYTKY